MKQINTFRFEKYLLHLIISSLRKCIQGYIFLRESNKLSNIYLALIPYSMNRIKYERYLICRFRKHSILLQNIIIKCVTLSLCSTNKARREQYLISLRCRRIFTKIKAWMARVIVKVQWLCFQIIRNK